MPVPISWEYIAVRGQEIHCMPVDFEEGIARHSGNPGLLDLDYDELCASNPPKGRSEQYDEYAQVDLTMLSLMFSTEPPTIPAHSALAPVSNVGVRVENIETAVDNRREATFLQLQIAQHKET